MSKLKNNTDIIFIYHQIYNVRTHIYAVKSARESDVEPKLNTPKFDVITFYNYILNVKNRNDFKKFLSHFRRAGIEN